MEIDVTRREQDAPKETGQPKPTQKKPKSTKRRTTKVAAAKSTVGATLPAEAPEPVAEVAAEQPASRRRRSTRTTRPRTPTRAKKAVAASDASEAPPSLQTPKAEAPEPVHAVHLDAIKAPPEFDAEERDWDLPFVQPVTAPPNAARQADMGRDASAPTGPRRRRRRRRGDRRGDRPQTEIEQKPDGPAIDEEVDADTDAGSRDVHDARDRNGGRSRRRRGRNRSAEAQPRVVDVAFDATDEDEEGDAIGTTEITRFVSRNVPVRSGTGAPMRELVINVSGGDECRIAVLQNGRLEELFIERRSTESHVHNIYKGRVVNVEPSIQAVFVDFGLPKHGFLHISDVQPQYFPDNKGQPEEVGRKTPRHHRPPIQKCFRRGQEVIVQITKEGVGTKGPTLTTYLSIPGRYLVMMPGMSRHGVSRKIEDEVERRKMRDIMDELKLPSGMGFILRTAGMGRTKRDMQRDLQYLMRLWKTVVERVQQVPSPAELYRESDLVTRTIRDVYTADFGRIVVDDADTAQKVLEFLQIAMPRTKAVVELYLEREPIFHRFGVEDEIDRINQRHVPLKSGGSLVIDSTEAMVTIDVNSGRFRTPDDAEETAFRLNLEAAEEIARQLRLRDLGGLIVCDFIDMRMDRHKRAVEKSLRDALKKHKERARILRMSAFGLIEMTRQRQGPSIKRNIYFDCPHCKGAGQVKMPESVILDVMRLVQLAAHHEAVQKITCTVATEVAFQLLNAKRTVLAEVEAETKKVLIVRGDERFTSDQIEVTCTDGRGQPVNIPALRPAELVDDRARRGWGKIRPTLNALPDDDENETEV